MSLKKPPNEFTSILEAAQGIPIIGSKPATRFTACGKGHVMEVPEVQVPTMNFQNLDGTIDTVVVCARCQFEFFASAFAAELMAPGTTRHEAEWRIRKLNRDACASVGIPCCKKGVGHEGDCELPEEKTS